MQHSVAIILARIFEDIEIMQQDFLNTWSEMGKNAYAAAKSFGELNSKLAEQMMERQLASVNLVVECG